MCQLSIKIVLLKESREETSHSDTLMYQSIRSSLTLPNGGGFK